MDSNIKGLTTELKCQLYLLEQGYNVSVPILSSSRYDLIVDINNKLYRIQIKTSNKTSAGFAFNCKSSHAKATGTNVIKPYTKEEIDFYMTIYQNEFFLIPVEDCGSSSKRLSLDIKAKNNQGQSTYYKNYLASEVLKRL